MSSFHRHLTWQVLIGVVVPTLLPAQNTGLSYRFSGHYGQVEVGGRYVGAEFHGSRPLPSRISFYYPVANSIDLSTDYWKRDASRPMVIGVKIGDGRKQWIGKEGWTYELSPHRVTFWRSEGKILYRLRYEFCLNQPAMVTSFVIENHGDASVSAEVYTHLSTVLRTCQTYARKDSAWTEYSPAFNLLAAHFTDPQTDRCVVFVQNVGHKPDDWTTSAREVGVVDSGSSRWLTSRSSLEHRLFTSRNGVPVAAFEYSAAIPAKDSLVIRQIIGSVRERELSETASRLSTSWRDEIDAYDEFVRLKAEQSSYFLTYDTALDRSVIWSKAILAANAHYLDKRILPMPCPAEYNFFFTHDVLMTDMGAVNFDLARVRSDLRTLVALAKDSVIPHAYYWRDDGFKTEYCTPDNWNHFWFVIVTGAYLRHSLDDSTGQLLAPLIDKSVSEIRSQVKDDYLMHAFRPDWWDFGRLEGSRAYMTVLAVRALREYLFISSFLHRESHSLSDVETLTDSMQAALIGRLWDRSTGYLMNYNGSRLDTHIYMGSLTGAAYGLLPRPLARELVGTASRRLLARGVGIRTVDPQDFSIPSVKSEYKIADNEAGDPFFYANGGVWLHDNAWYALGLYNAGETAAALDAVRTTMTVDGILRSPMGQPAMYEYRYSDSTSARYGWIDKPNFLWGGGFYLKTLYALFGVNENEWNLSLAGSLPPGFDSVRYSLTLTLMKDVRISVAGSSGRRLTTEQGGVPSLVLPIGLSQSRSIDLVVGNPVTPMLDSVNCILHDAAYHPEDRTLELRVSSFEGHHAVATISSPARPSRVTLDGTWLSSFESRQGESGAIETAVRFTGAWKPQVLRISF